MSAENKDVISEPAVPGISPAPGDPVALDENKAQILWNGDSMIVVIPCHKIGRPFARGILLDADDMLIGKYMELQARKKPDLIVPSHSTGIKGKLSKLWGRQ